jgi:hypothetical protein
MTGILLTAGLAVLTVAGYAIECWWWPLAHCYCCKGAGKHARADGKVFRNCWWCKGSGRRWRFGRRLWNWWHRHR